MFCSDELDGSQWRWRLSSAGSPFSVQHPAKRACPFQSIYIVLFSGDSRFQNELCVLICRCFYLLPCVFCCDCNSSLSLSLVEWFGKGEDGSLLRPVLDDKIGKDGVENERTNVGALRFYKTPNHVVVDCYMKPNIHLFVRKPFDSIVLLVIWKI